MNIVQLRGIMPASSVRVDRYFDPLLAAMHEFDITADLRREAAFLAQIAHESGELRYTREIADGWAYERRDDLGNTKPGDGPRYKGGGFIQVTGRANYKSCGDYLGLPLIDHPELLTDAVPACRSACWFWSVHKKLNALADNDEFGAITKKINGGYNGLDHRIAYWLRARRVLGIQ